MTIRLETEDGIALKEFCDSKEVVSRRIASCLGDLPPLQLARYIMPFGRTVFNKSQMPYLLLDLERLIVKAADAEEIGLLRLLRTFVLECQADVHVYVTFTGTQEGG